MKELERLKNQDYLADDEVEVWTENRFDESGVLGNRPIHASA